MVRYDDFLEDAAEVFEGYISSMEGAVDVPPIYDQMKDEATLYFMARQAAAAERKAAALERIADAMEWKNEEDKLQGILDDDKGAEL